MIVRSIRKDMMLEKYNERTLLNDQWINMIGQSPTLSAIAKENLEES